MALAFAMGCTSLCGCSPGTDGRSPKAADPGVLRIHVIDVGKGDCILVQCGGQNLLIDTGYDSTADDVVKYLKSAGVGTIDCLMITHYHKDHVGGAAQIVSSFDVDRVFLPDYEWDSEYCRNFAAALERKGLTGQKVLQDTDLDLGGSKLRILASDIEFDAADTNHNDCSLVSVLSFGRDSFLFAADIEKDGINAFLEENSTAFDVVKIPHHGNRDKKMDDFISAVSPRIALITDSKDDTATDDNLERLEKCGALVYRTSICGTIVLESTGAGEYTVK